MEEYRIVSAAVKEFRFYIEFYREVDAQRPY